MNPTRIRFRLSTLLALMAFAALDIAAAQDPPSYWNSIQFYCWFALMILLAVLAAQGDSRRTVFARGMLASTLVYAVLPIIESNGGWGGHLLPRLPHHYLRSLVFMPEAFSGLQFVSFNDGRYEAQMRWSLVNTSLFCGFLGGYLSIWWRTRTELKGFAIQKVELVEVDCVPPATDAAAPQQIVTKPATDSAADGRLRA